MTAADWLVLIAGGGGGGGGLIVGRYYLWAQLQTIHWSLIWLLDGGFSLILYTIVMLSIAVLWRPNSNSHRYAYAQVNPDESEADEYGLDAGAGGAGPTGADGVELGDTGLKRGQIGPGMSSVLCLLSAVCCLSVYCMRCSGWWC